MAFNIFDDTIVAYNYEQGRYIPQQTLYAKYLNVQIDARYKEAKDRQVFSDLISRGVYRHFFSNKKPEDNDKNRFKLGDDIYRQTLINAFVYQAEYAFADGGHEIALQHGINLVEGENIDPKLFEELQVSVQTKQILRENELMYGDRLDFSIPQGLVKGVDF